MTTLADDFIVAIIEGDLDDDLDNLREAIKDRREYLASRVRLTLKVMDTVRFSDVIRPKYLVGLTATVVKVNPKSVVVNCPTNPAYGRFSGARNVRCPLSLIEGKVENV